MILELTDPKLKKENTGFYYVHPFTYRLSHNVCEVSVPGTCEDANFHIEQKQLKDQAALFKKPIYHGIVAGNQSPSLGLRTACFS